MCQPLLESLKKENSCTVNPSSDVCVAALPYILDQALSGNLQRCFIIMLPLAPTHLPHSTIHTYATDTAVASVDFLFVFGECILRNLAENEEIFDWR